MNQPSYNERFHVHYCYYVEHMTEIFNRRIANFITLVQVITGSAVMASLANSILAGLVVTILAAIMFVYKPGEVAEKARLQARRYEKLLNRIDNVGVSKSELDNTLNDYLEYDSAIPTSLVNPAYIRAAIACGSEKDAIESEIKKMKFAERFCSFICGGIPR